MLHLIRRNLRGLYKKEGVVIPEYHEEHSLRNTSARRNQVQPVTIDMVPDAHTEDEETKAQVYPGPQYDDDEFKKQRKEYERKVARRSSEILAVPEGQMAQAETATILHSQVFQRQQPPKSEQSSADAPAAASPSTADEVANGQSSDPNPSNFESSQRPVASKHGHHGKRSSLSAPTSLPPLHAMAPSIARLASTHSILTTDTQDADTKAPTTNVSNNNSSGDALVYADDDQPYSISASHEDHQPYVKPNKKPTNTGPQVLTGPQFTSLWSSLPAAGSLQVKLTQVPSIDLLTSHFKAQGFHVVQAHANRTEGVKVREEIELSICNKRAPNTVNDTNKEGRNSDPEGWFMTRMLVINLDFSAVIKSQSPSTMADHVKRFALGKALQIATG